MNTCALLLLCSLIPSVDAPAGDAALERADKLRKSSNVAELEEASRIYTAALEKDPNNVLLLTNASNVLTDVVAHKTNGATATTHGTQDTPEFREIWRTVAKQAADLADRAYAIQPNNPRVAFQYAASYGYYSGSFGIVAAITKGAATEFKKRAQHIIDVAPELDDGGGYYLMGLMLLIAPWPVGSTSDAGDYLTLALQQSPTSVRNNYVLGVQRFEAKQKDDAKRYFQAAVDLPCHEKGSERMFCDFLKAESKKNLEILARP